MIRTLTNHYLFNFDYYQVFGLTLLYFSFLYFGIAPLFNALCRYLHTRKILNRIIEPEAEKKQIIREIKNSCISLLIFGFSGLPVVYLIRNGTIQLLPDSIWNITWGLLVINLWNEVHFYLVHHLMHLPFFMRHVHYVHHRSKTPDVYSVYSFHWVEAFLLSTVPVTITPFIPVAPMAIMLYPLASILLNYTGHCNYRFGNGTKPDWKSFASRHHTHHSSGTKNLGFALNVFDKIFSGHLRKSNP